MIASTTRSQLRRCLNDVQFPASRDDLLDAARRAGCDNDTVSALQALAPMTYSRAEQILASMTTVTGAEGDAASAAQRSESAPNRR